MLIHSMFSALIASQGSPIRRVACKYTLASSSKSLSCSKVSPVCVGGIYLLNLGFIERMATSGINEYYKNLGTYLQSHHERIQKEMSGGGMVAGKDLILERPSRGSFHSLSDSNDGYASDVDECGDISNKRSVSEGTKVLKNSHTDKTA